MACLLPQVRARTSSFFFFACSWSFRYVACSRHKTVHCTSCFCKTQPDLDGNRRCGAYATLDRAKESQRDKDRLLSTGKGNARTTECWLRVHQSCNADWSHLMSTSLEFRVPSGYRFFNSKQPCVKHKSPHNASLLALCSISQSKHAWETEWTTAFSTCFCWTQEALI